MPGSDFLAPEPTRMGWGAMGGSSSWTDGMSDSLTGMNAAVRAVTRMGIYVGAKVFLIYEVSGRGGGLW